MASTGHSPPLAVISDLGAFVEFPESLPTIYVLPFGLGEVVNTETPEGPSKRGSVSYLLSDLGKPVGLLAGSASASRRRIGIRSVGHANWIGHAISSRSTGLDPRTLVG